MALTVHNLVVDHPEPDGHASRELADDYSVLVARQVARNWRPVVRRKLYRHGAPPSHASP